MSYENVIKAKQGCRRSLARSLTAIEDGSLEIGQALSVLEPLEPSDSWRSAAITGAPGVGKSCLVDRLLTQWAKDGRNIALLAVDPSSPRSGGALLGDRVRMTVVDDPVLKNRVYVRSIATRKASGSVPVIVEDMTTLLLALGWEKVIIETVGAGQSEIRCAAIADRIIVVEGPARGDGVQAEKAGLLELADAVLVNKSDMDGAMRHADEIRESFELGEGAAPPVLLTSAMTGEGCGPAADLLWDLDSTGRAEKARWRERILASIERRVLSNPGLDELLELLSSGSIELDEALEKLGEKDE